MTNTAQQTTTKQNDIEPSDNGIGTTLNGSIDKIKADKTNSGEIARTNDTTVTAAKLKRREQIAKFAWPKGVSGNPKGRPKGCRNAVCEEFLRDLRSVWNTEGNSVLKRVAKKQPEKLLAAMVAVLPKDFQVTVDSEQVTWVINAQPRLTENEWVAKHTLEGHTIEHSDETD